MLINWLKYAYTALMHLSIDSSTIQNISCFGADDGSIDIEVSVGTTVTDAIHI